MEASAAPPRTEKSSPLTTTLRPSIRPVPKTLLAGVNSSSSPPGPYLGKPASPPHSSKLPASRRASILSRTVSRPASFCRLTRSGPPIFRASSSRRRSSSTSGCQVTDLEVCRLRLEQCLELLPRCRLPGGDVVGRPHPGRLGVVLQHQARDCRPVH